MPAGKYWLRLDWLQFMETIDENTGEKTPKYKVKKLWGTYDEPKPHEKVYFGSLGQAVDCKISVNNVPGIGYSDRMRYGNLVFDIVSVFESLTETTVWGIMIDDRGGLNDII